eukprot:15263014-Ditylum_brightwellii.AAC.1
MTHTRECNAILRCCCKFWWISAIAAFCDAKSSSRSSMGFWLPEMGVSSSSCGFAIPCNTAAYDPTALLAALLARLGIGNPSNFGSLDTRCVSGGGFCTFL